VRYGLPPPLYKENHAVYYDDKELEEVVPSSFEDVNGFYFKDENGAYYKGTLIQGVDRETFIVTGSHTAEDKNHQYKGGDRI